MVEHMVVGGQIAMLGIPSRPAPVDWTRIVFKLLTIKGIYGREMFETWHKMIAMLQSGLAVRKVITHRMSARDFREGFEAMRAGMSGKIVLDWTDI
jgi:threonine 3-dehydrogenase